MRNREHQPLNPQNGIIETINSIIVRLLRRDTWTIESVHFKRWALSIIIIFFGITGFFMRESYEFKDWFFTLLVVVLISILLMMLAKRVFNAKLAYLEVFFGFFTVIYTITSLVAESSNYVENTVSEVTHATNEFNRSINKFNKTVNNLEEFNYEISFFLEGNSFGISLTNTSQENNNPQSNEESSESEGSSPDIDATQSADNETASNEVFTCSDWLADEFTSVPLRNANFGRAVWGVAFSDDGRFLAAGEGTNSDSGRIRVWSVNDEGQRPSFTPVEENLTPESNNPTRSIIFLPTSGDINRHDIVSGHHQGQMWLWRGRSTDNGNSWTYDPISIETPHKPPVISLALSADGNLLASASAWNDGKGGNDPKGDRDDGESIVALWRVVSDDTENRLELLRQYNLFDDLTSLSGGTEIAITTQAGENEDADKPDKRISVVNLTFSPDSDFLAVSYQINSYRSDERIRERVENNIAIYKIEEDNSLTFRYAQARAHSDAIYGLTFSKGNDILASGGFDKYPAARFWQITEEGSNNFIIRKLNEYSKIYEGQELYNSNEEQDNSGIRSLDFCSDSLILASGIRNGFMFISEATHDEQGSTEESYKFKQVYADSIYSLKFSPDGRLLATGSADGDVSVHYISQ